MIIGVPKEIKNNENRVGMTPSGVAEIVKRGHTVTYSIPQASTVVFPMQPIQPWERRFYLPWKKYMPLPK